MAYYNIINKATGKAVNISGSNIESLTAHQNVTLFSNSGSNEQIWKINSLSSSNTQILSYVDESFGFNVNRRQGANYYNCDVLAVSGNATDAAIKLVLEETLMRNYYRIALANYSDYYLTPVGTSNGSNIKWSTYQDNDLQLWYFDPVDIYEKERRESEEYHLYSHYTGKYLKAGGYNRLTSDTTPAFDDFSYLNRQRWHIKGTYDYFKLVSKHGDWFSLCNNNSTAIVSATAPGENAYLRFNVNEQLDGDLYIIHTPTNLYLTAKQTGVTWEPYKGVDNDLSQYWKLTKDSDANIHNGVGAYILDTNPDVPHENPEDNPILPYEIELTMAGEEFICRNIAGGGKMTDREVEAFSNTSLVSIYPLATTATFSRAKGREDAIQAIAEAQRIGQDNGSAIYFAINSDYSSSTLENIVLYFDGIYHYFHNSTNNPNNYKVGVYGSGYVCNRIKQVEGLAEYSFLAAPTGWTGYASYDDPTKYNIKQGEPIIYLDTTFDDNTAIGDNYGQWSNLN